MTTRKSSFDRRYNERIIEGRDFLSFFVSLSGKHSVEHRSVYIKQRFLFIRKSLFDRVYATVGAELGAGIGRSSFSLTNYDIYGKIKDRSRGSAPSLPFDGYKIYFRTGRAELHNFTVK